MSLSQLIDVASGVAGSEGIVTLSDELASTVHNLVAQTGHSVRMKPIGGVNHIKCVDLVNLVNAATGVQTVKAPSSEPVPTPELTDSDYIGPNPVSSSTSSISTTTVTDDSEDYSDEEESDEEVESEEEEGEVDEEHQEEPVKSAKPKVSRKKASRKKS